MMKKINVTKTFLPPVGEYKSYIDQIWENGQITNSGELHTKLEKKLKEYLSVNELHMMANGTLSLQIALRALDITEGEVITTPFSYVATTSAIMWEHCEPVFVDIEPDTFCIDAEKIEVAITSKTKAIMPVHVFGFPCDIEKIDAIAEKHNLKVIYDAAHAFGVEYKGRSLLDYGDISTCSFHATKLFHTIEGGCIIAKDKTVGDKAEILKRFGHTGDEHFMLGINAKSSEFQAAMGLCNLKYITEIIEARKQIFNLYDRNIGNLDRPRPNKDTTYNYSYYPVVLESKEHLINKLAILNSHNIFPRRYFYPSLNQLPYINNNQSCPISEDISMRILCLPLYEGIEPEIINKICEIIRK